MNRKRVFVLLILAFGSYFYNRFIDSRDDEFMEKYTWATVIVGVLYTLVGVWFIDQRAARISFVAFCFSGAAMAVGDLRRYFIRRQNGERILAGFNGRKR
ncbi:MAG: hypothetical protein IAE79_07310 [Anaerolinea sp.]|nr:hypothetical protein [Anaerolinea sp.]